jgi:hypothetical protein
MEPIEAQLVENPGSNQQAAGHPNSQPGDIDQGIPGLPPDAPEHDFDIISQHAILAYSFLEQKVCQSYAGESSWLCAEKKGCLCPGTNTRCP